MRYDYRFCMRYETELIKFLDENNIKYKLSGPLGDFFSNGTPVPVFAIFEIKGHLPIVDYLCDNFRCQPQINVFYSTKEINNAPFIWITPKKQIIDIVNEEKAYYFSCRRVVMDGTTRSRHQRQIQPFMISKEPSTKTQTAFWTSSTGFSEVFADKRVKEIVEFSNLQGVEFRETILRNGSHSNNIFQLTTCNKISSDYIVFGKGEEEIICPMCGKKQYALNNIYQLHLNLDIDKFTEDLYITEDIFGSGIPYPIYLISQRFYQLLKKHKLNSNMHCDPVIIENTEGRFCCVNPN